MSQDAVQAAIQAARDERKAAEAQAKAVEAKVESLTAEVAEARSALAAAREAPPTPEVETLRAEVARIQTETAGTGLLLDRYRAAASAGLPLAFAERLKGDDREALEADARTFAPFLRASAAPDFIGTANQEHARLVADMFGPGHGR
jgi:hypothetical protein